MISLRMRISELKIGLNHSLVNSEQLKILRAVRIQKTKIIFLELEPELNYNYSYSSQLLTGRVEGE